MADLADVALAALNDDVHGVLEGVADEHVVALLCGAVREAWVRVIEHKVCALAALPSAGVQHCVVARNQPVPGLRLLLRRLAAPRVHLPCQIHSCAD